MKTSADKARASRRISNDLQSSFREYMRLERKRETGGGLSVSELQYWGRLKAALNHTFQPGTRPEVECRRQSLRVPVKVSVAFESCGEIRESLMTNLSRGGLFIATDSPLEIGAKVELRIAIADFGRPLDVMTEVVSQNTGGDLRRNEPGMGLRFVDLNEANKAKIDELYSRSASRAVDKATHDGD